MTAHAPIRIYANSHMIAEPSARNQESVLMSPDPFLLVRVCMVGSGNETVNSFDLDMTAGHAQTIPIHYTLNHSWESTICALAVQLTYILLRPHQSNFMSLGSADRFFLFRDLEKNDLIKNHKHVTHDACVNHNI